MFDQLNSYYIVNAEAGYELSQIYRNYVQNIKYEQSNYIPAVHFTFFFTIVFLSLCGT